MAQTLGFGLDEFGEVALRAEEAVRISLCIRPLLEVRLGVPVIVPERAQFVVALGAALSIS